MQAGDVAVKLPSAPSLTMGILVTNENVMGVSALVFPDSSAISINGQAPGSPVTVAPGTSRNFAAGQGITGPIYWSA